MVSSYHVVYIDSCYILFYWVDIAVPEVLVMYYYY